MQVRIARALIVFVALLFAPVAIAQECPCWTAEELAAIQVNPACYCQNNLDLSAPAYFRCTTININSSADDGACSTPPSSGTHSHLIVRESIHPDYDFECSRFDQSAGTFSVEYLTNEEASICALEIAEKGAVAEPRSVCSATGVFCDGANDCPNPVGLCSLEGTVCTTGADCRDAGTCGALEPDGSQRFCEADADCPGLVNFCLNVQPQSCDYHENLCRPEPGCLDECYPPGCRFQPTLEAPETVVIEFTQQAFEVVRGTISELEADGDYSRANCDAPATDTEPLPPGNVRYYLVRAVQGVSCTDHGDSGLSPDPRDALDAMCMP